MLRVKIWMSKNLCLNPKSILINSVSWPINLPEVRFLICETRYWWQQQVVWSGRCHHTSCSGEAWLVVAGVAAGAAVVTVPCALHPEAGDYIIPTLSWLGRTHSQARSLCTLKPGTTSPLSPAVCCRVNMERRRAVPRAWPWEQPPEPAALGVSPLLLAGKQWGQHGGPRAPTLGYKEAWLGLHAPRSWQEPGTSESPFELAGWKLPRCSGSLRATTVDPGISALSGT